MPNTTTTQEAGGMTRNAKGLNISGTAGRAHEPAPKQLKARKIAGAS